MGVVTWLEDPVMERLLSMLVLQDMRRTSSQSRRVHPCMKTKEGRWMISDRMQGHWSNVKNDECWQADTQQLSSVLSMLDLHAIIAVLIANVVMMDNIRWSKLLEIDCDAFGSGV